MYLYILTNTCIKTNMKNRKYVCILKIKFLHVFDLIFASFLTTHTDLFWSEEFCIAVNYNSKYIYYGAIGDIKIMYIHK